MYGIIAYFRRKVHLEIYDSLRFQEVPGKVPVKVPVKVPGKVPG